MENQKIDYVLINENEIVTDRDNLEEEIYELLEEDLEAEIKVYPTTKNNFCLDAEYIVESLYDDDIISECSEFPKENIEQLKKLLDDWCLKAQKVTNTTYEVNYKKEIDITEIVEKIKKEILEEKNK